MPIADDLRWSVAFVISDETDPQGITERKPIGTGFFVSFREGLTEDSSESIWFTYFVTAAHVVRGATNEAIRVHTKTRTEQGLERPGPVKDLPVSHWFYNPDRHKDTAIAAVDISSKAYYLDSIHPPHDWRGGIPTFREPMTRRHARPEIPSPWRFRDRAALGQRALYVGLLTNVKQMGRDNIPMVRSGTIGAFHQEGIPVRFREDEPSMKVTAHLLDSQSYGGFSGSPVWLYREAYDLTSRRVPVRSQYHVRRIGGDTETEYGLALVEQTEFLGMVIGHFDYHEKIGPDRELSGGNRGSFWLPLNAGVAVVVPQEYIWETLTLEEAVADRAQRIREATDGPECHPEDSRPEKGEDE